MLGLLLLSLAVSSSNLQPIHRQQQPPAAMAAESVSSDELEEMTDVSVLYGPKKLPGNGRGTITSNQRA